MRNEVKATSIIRLQPNGVKRLYPSQCSPCRSLHREFALKEGYTFFVFLDLLENLNGHWTYSISMAEQLDDARELLGFINVMSSDLACDQLETFFSQHQAQPVGKGWWGRGPQFKRA